MPRQSGRSVHTAEGAAAPDPVDGILLVSFGGPRGPEDVMPFLENVTAGRGIPRDRLEVVARHYYSRGGVSPINAETEALVAAMEQELALARMNGTRTENDCDRGIAVFQGNRNWSPTIDDALADAAARGHRHLAVVLTSAYSGYSGCRQYRENLAGSVGRLTESGVQVPRLSFVRPWGLHPDVIDAWTRLGVPAVRAALEDEDGDAATVELVFVAHSIPTAAARAAGPPGDTADGGAYVSELTTVARLVAERVDREVGIEVAWSLAFCSRSGPPSQPWLEPDISDALTELVQRGARSVVAVPIGFVADHMEVIQDLDTVAAGDAARLGLAWRRVPTLRDDTAVAARLVRLALAAGESPGRCPAGCCAPVGRPGAATTAPPAAFEGS